MAKKKRSVLCRSDRLYLSLPSLSDAPTFVKWFNDPEIFGHLRDLNHRVTLEEQKNWIQQLEKDPSQKIFCIYYIPDDHLIGYGGFSYLQPEDRKAEVGMALGEKNYQGMGLGAESLWLVCKYGFENLGLHNILGENYADNLVAINNAKKIGLRYFGTRRQSRNIAGKRLDVHYSDMLPHELIKPEFRKNQ